MTIDDNKAVTRRLPEELNKRNFDVLDELIDDSYVERRPIFPAPFGKQQAIELFRSVYDALPDLHRTMDAQIAEGDLVVDRIIYRGTHKGDFLGIPATNKTAEMTAILVFRVAGGKIVENWSVLDMLGMMQQLGVVPAIGGAS